MSGQSILRLLLWRTVAGFLISALYAGARYGSPVSGVAGAAHIAARSRSLNENVAMLSDVFLFAILAAFVIAEAVSRQ